MPDVTAIINLRHEGLAALASLDSLLASTRQAESAGIAVEMLAVTDGRDAATSNVAEAARSEGCRILPTTCGDVGPARNAAVAASVGRYVAFLDAPHLWSANWLLRAHASAVADGDQTAWHPECSITCWADLAPQIIRHPDMIEDVHIWSRLAVENPWSAFAFAPRALVASVPYPATGLDDATGQAEWGWNLAVVDAGCNHRTVPGTVHLIRTGLGHAQARARGSDTLPVPTDLFRRRSSDPPGTLGLI